MICEVRALTVADVDEFRRIRLDALRRHPEAFGSAYEDEVALDRGQFAERLGTTGITRFGGLSGGALVGLAGLAILYSVAWSFYPPPAPSEPSTPVDLQRGF